MKPAAAALSLLSAAALVSVALPAPAAIYQWTDATGQKHYSQTPPVGAKTRSVETRDSASSALAPSAATPEPRSSTADTNRAWLKAREAEQAAAQKQRDKAAAEATLKAERERVCANAQTQLEKLKNWPPNRLMAEDAKGQMVRLTPEAAQQRKDQAQKVVTESCGK